MRLTLGFDLISGRPCGGTTCSGEADAGNLARLLAAHYSVVRLCAWSRVQHLRASSHTSLLKAVSESEFLSSSFTSSFPTSIISRIFVLSMHRYCETVYSSSQCTNSSNFVFAQRLGYS